MKKLVALLLVLLVGLFCSYHYSSSARTKIGGIGDGRIGRILSFNFSGHPRTELDAGKGVRWTATENGIRLMAPAGSWIRWRWTGSSADGLAEGDGVLLVRERAVLPFGIAGDWVEAGEISFHRGVPTDVKPSDLPGAPTASFHGRVKNGEPSGGGVLVEGSRTTIGTFRNRKTAKGEVIVFEDDREVYRGGFRNGSYAGTGRLVLPDGSTYEGGFRGGEFDGRGRLAAADGTLFEGWFRNGRRHGIGVLTSAEGIRSVDLYRNGEVHSTIAPWMSRLDERRGELGEDSWFRARRALCRYDDNHRWIDPILWIVFLIPIVFLCACTPRPNEFSTLDQYLDAPMSTRSLFHACLYGGAIGFHKWKARNRLWIVYAALSTAWMLFNTTNIAIALASPSSALSLWDSPAGAWISFGLLAALIVFDLIVGIRYDTYRFNARYWRSTNREPIEEAIEIAMEVPERVEECLVVADENLQFLKAENEEDVEHSILDLFTNGRIDREREKLEVLEHAYDAVVSKSRDFAGEAKMLETELLKARRTATRNFKLAKELFSHYQKVSGKQDTTIIDDLALKDIEDISVDVEEAKSIEMPSFDFDGLFGDLSGILSGAGDALGGWAQAADEDSDDDDAADGVAKAVGGVFSLVSNAVSAGARVLEHNRRKKEIVRQIVQTQLKVVEAADKACANLLENKAKVLRAGEIVKALAECNKAFIQAYQGLRDAVFGPVSFATFRVGENLVADRFMEERRGSEELARSLAHLASVCTDYKKVSLAEVVPEETESDAETAPAQGDETPGPSEDDSDSRVGLDAPAANPTDEGSDLDDESLSENDGESDRFEDGEEEGAAAEGKAREESEGGVSKTNETIPGIPRLERSAPPAAKPPALPSAEPSNGSKSPEQTNAADRPAMRYSEFIAAGIFTGWFGMHLAYAARWMEFAISMALAVFAIGVPPLGAPALVVWWIATFFVVRTDGRNRRFRSIFDAMRKAAGGSLLSVAAMTPKEKRAFNKKVKSMYYAPSCPDRSPYNRIVYILLSLFVGATGLNNLYIRSMREGRVSIALLVALLVSIIPNAFAYGGEWAGLLAMPCAAMFFWNFYCAFFVSEDGRGRKLRWF